MKNHCGMNAQVLSQPQQKETDFHWLSTCVFVFQIQWLYVERPVQSAAILHPSGKKLEMKCKVAIVSWTRVLFR